jgi:hypothetical protein
VISPLDNIEGQVTRPLTIISAVMPQVLERPPAAYERQNRQQAPPRGAPGLLRTTAGIGLEPAELEPSPDPRKARRVRISARRRIREGVGPASSVSRRAHENAGRPHRGALSSSCRITATMMASLIDRVIQRSGRSPARRKSARRCQSIQMKALNKNGGRGRGAISCCSNAGSASFHVCRSSEGHTHHQQESPEGEETHVKHEFVWAWPDVVDPQDVVVNDALDEVEDPPPGEDPSQ